MVTLGNYTNPVADMGISDNFGISGQETGELLKAMNAGSLTGRETAGAVTGFQALKLESLENSLKSLEFRETDIKIWNQITKLPAYNTVEEFDTLVSYGDQTGGFYNEGETPIVIDSKYQRKASFVKYLQIGGEVTLQAQMVRSIVPAMSTEVDNKMKWMMGLANKYLALGDSRFIPENWDGIYAQLSDIGSNGQRFSSWDEYWNSSMVVDLRGATLKQIDLERAAVKIDSEYGVIKELFGTTDTISGISQDYFQIQRILQNAGSGYEGKMGVNIKTIGTTIGDVSLNSDKFMKTQIARRIPQLATHTNAPAAPVPDGTTPKAVVSGDTLSKYVAADAGDVYYAVSAINRYGESPLVLLGSAAVTIAAGSVVNLKFTAGSGTYAASAFKIYRSVKNAPGTAATTMDFYPIITVTQTDITNGYSGGAAGLIRDRGYILPNTEQAFAGNLTPEYITFKQLAPISKLDLAITGPTNKFMILLYGTPQLYTPNKFVRFINVGKTVL